MRRRGSMPFVVEIKSSRKRFTPGIPGPAHLEKRSPGFHVNGADALFTTPWNDTARTGGPSVENARLAADRLFGGLGTSESLRPRNDQQTDGRAAPAAGAAAVGSRDDTPCERPNPEMPANVPDAKPRTGRILESLTSKDPLEALFRQRAEEEATPRRGRPPGSRNFRHDEGEAAGELHRNRIPERSAADLSPSPAKSGTAGFSSKGESQSGDPHPPAAEIPRGKSRRDAQNPVRRRKPTSRTRTLNTRRPGKARAYAKRNAGLGVTRKAASKDAGGSQRQRTKPSVTNGAVKRPGQAKRADRNKVTKRRALAPTKGAARKKAVTKKAVTKRAVTKRAAGGWTGRNTVVRNQAARKAAASKAGGNRMSRGRAPAKNSLKAKTTLRTAKRGKTAVRKRSPARRRTRP